LGLKLHTNTRYLTSHHFAAVRPTSLFTRRCEGFIMPNFIPEKLPGWICRRMPIPIIDQETLTPHRCKVPTNQNIHKVSCNTYTQITLPNVCLCLTYKKLDSNFISCFISVTSYFRSGNTASSENGLSLSKP